MKKAAKLCSPLKWIRLIWRIFHRSTFKLTRNHSWKDAEKQKKDSNCIIKYFSKNFHPLSEKISKEKHPFFLRVSRCLKINLRLKFQIPPREIRSCRKIVQTTKGNLNLFKFKRFQVWERLINVIWVFPFSATRFNLAIIFTNYNTQHFANEVPLARPLIHT